MDRFLWRWILLCNDQLRLHSNELWPDPLFGYYVCNIMFLNFFLINNNTITGSFSHHWIKFELTDQNLSFYEFFAVFPSTRIFDAHCVWRLTFFYSWSWSLCHIQSVEYIDHGSNITNSFKNWLRYGSIISVVTSWPAFAVMSRFRLY